MHQGILPLANDVFRPGDLVFSRTKRMIFKHLDGLTQSPASHVGILFNDEMKGWVVAESTAPFCTYTPLSKFAADSQGGWISVRRPIPEITEQQIDRLRNACDQRMREWYTLSFCYESKGQFCSKFVHGAYHDALGLSIGKVETFESIIKQNPHSSTLFLEVFFLGRIPLRKTTITPGSVYLDPRMEPLFEGSVRCDTSRCSLCFS